MWVRWTVRAQAEFDHQMEYVAADNLPAAFQLRNLVHQHTQMLADFPEMGRAGRVGNSRELVIAGTPYIAIYRLGKESVEIFRFLHGAQKYP